MTGQAERGSASSPAIDGATGQSLLAAGPQTPPLSPPPSPVYGIHQWERRHGGGACQRSAFSHFACLRDCSARDRTPNGCGPSRATGTWTGPCSGSPGPGGRRPRFLPPAPTDTWTGPGSPTCCPGDRRGSPGSGPLPSAPKVKWLFSSKISLIQRKHYLKKKKKFCVLLRLLSISYTADLGIMRFFSVITWWALDS